MMPMTLAAIATEYYDDDAHHGFGVDNDDGADDDGDCDYSANANDENNANHHVGDGEGCADNADADHAANNHDIDAKREDGDYNYDDGNAIHEYLDDGDGAGLHTESCCG